MRRFIVPPGVAKALVWILVAAGPVLATSRERPQTSGTNPFENPDDDLDRFAVPEDLPPVAGTVSVPKEGPWDAMNFLGEMVCTGIVNLNLPLEPVRDAGTIEVRNNGQTLFGDGFSDETEDITMESVPGLTGRFAGTVSGSPGGVPMSIDYFWQIVTDEWIIGYLTSHVDTQGMTCNMYRTYELVYSGEGEPEGRAAICHRPPGNPENAHTITVGEAAVSAHLDHGDSLGPCPQRVQPR